MGVYLELERGSELLLPDLQGAHLRGQGQHRGGQAGVFILRKIENNLTDTDQLISYKKGLKAGLYKQKGYTAFYDIVDRRSEFK